MNATCGGCRVLGTGEVALLRGRNGPLIRSAHATGAKVGPCGQRSGDNPDDVRLLVAAGTNSISVTPDRFLRLNDYVAAAERGEDR